MRAVRGNPKRQNHGDSRAFRQELGASCGLATLFLNGLAIGPQPALFRCVTALQLAPPAPAETDRQAAPAAPPADDAPAVPFASILRGVETRDDDGSGEPPVEERSGDDADERVTVPVATTLPSPLVLLWFGGRGGADADEAETEGVEAPAIDGGAAGGADPVELLDTAPPPAPLPDTAAVVELNVEPTRDDVEPPPAEDGPAIEKTAPKAPSAVRLPVQPVEAHDRDASNDNAGGQQDASNRFSDGVATGASRPAAQIATEGSFSTEAPDTPAVLALNETGSTGRVRAAAEAPRALEAPRLAVRVEAAQATAETGLKAAVDVVMQQRGPILHFSVHSADPVLAAEMRTSLGELTGNLEKAGFRAEAWNPVDRVAAVAESAGAELSDRDRQPGGSSEDRQGERNRDGSPQGRRNRNQWKSEIESRLFAPAATLRTKT